MKNKIITEILKTGISFVAGFAILLICNAPMIMVIENRGYIEISQVILLTTSLFVAVVCTMFWYFKILKNFKL